MKLEIDLNDILGDEYGDTESLAESVKRQVVEGITTTLQQRVDGQVSRKVSEAIDKHISNEIEKQMPSIVDDLMHKEYTPVTSYGSKGEPTTFRDAVIKTITEKLVYKSERSSYDKNVFTAAVDNVIEAKMKEFREQFDLVVNEEFTKKVISTASEELKKKLDI